MLFRRFKNALTCNCLFCRSSLIIGRKTGTAKKSFELQLDPAGAMPVPGDDDRRGSSKSETTWFTRTIPVPAVPVATAGSIT